MPRGGGGGMHSSFHHSSFGGTHSSYHHSSSSSSSSHHSSYSSSHRSSSSSYSKPKSSSSSSYYTSVTTTSDYHEDKPKKSRSDSNYDYMMSSYNNDWFKTSAKRTNDAYELINTPKHRYEQNVNQINHLKDKMMTIQTENNSKRNIFKVRFHKQLFTSLIASIVLTVILCIMSISTYVSSYNKTVTDTFEKLSPEQCIKANTWYTDNWGTWITNQDVLIKGLEYFYNETGAQPYIYITGEEGIHYSSEELVQGLAEEVYTEKFSDGGHIVLIFREYPDASGDWYADVYSGNAVTSVLGKDISDVIMNYLVKYYDYSSLTDDEMFAKVFTSTADQLHNVCITKEVTFDHKCFVYLVLAIFAGVLIGIFGFLVISGNQELYEISSNEKTIDALEDRIKDITNDNKEIENQIVSSKECPNCGANIQINALGNGKCTYCGYSISDKA